MSTWQNTGQKLILDLEKISFKWCPKFEVMRRVTFPSIIGVQLTPPTDNTILRDDSGTTGERNTKSKKTQNFDRQPTETDSRANKRKSSISVNSHGSLLPLGLASLRPSDSLIVALLLVLHRSKLYIGSSCPNGKGTNFAWAPFCQADSLMKNYAATDKITCMLNVANSVVQHFRKWGVQRGEMSMRTSPPKP